MARIEEKVREEKVKKSLAGKVWAWVVGVVLTLVFIGSVVLLVLFILNKDEEETPVEEATVTYEEKYPEAQLITFADLEDKILNDHRDTEDLIGTNYDVIYVFVYSPDYETYPNGEKVSTNVNAMIAACGDNSGDGVKFFVINTETDDNKAFDLTNSPLLAGAATFKSPYLIKIIISEAGPLVIDEFITGIGDINNELYGNLN